MKNMGVPVTALASADAMWRSPVGRCTLSRRSTALEAPDVEAQFVCVRDEIGEVQVVLALQQQGVHGPERSLCRCGFDCLRSQGRVWVDIAEREVAPDVVHLRVGREQFAGDRLGRATVRAFEVPVLDDCDRCVGSVPVTAARCRRAVPAFGEARAAAR